MTAQYDLPYNDRDDRNRRWGEILEAVADVAKTVGLKQAAYDLDKAPSELTHAIAQRDRHYLYSWQLLYFLDHAPDDELAKLLVGKRYDLSPKKELEPSQKLERLLEVVEGEPGESVAGVLLKKAGLK